MIDLKKVLIVDDDGAFTDMLTSALAGAYTVVSSVDGARGIAMARAEAPDVIVMDVMMPNMTGLEALRALQEDDRTARIPVLICTASVFDPAMRDVFRIEPNCAGFFPKTAPLGFISGVVARALNGEKIP